MNRRREPARRELDVDGARLCYFEWGELRADAATVLLAHATGFHARVWDATIDALDPATHVIAVDQRGHGRSSKQGPFTWERFGADLIALVDAIGAPKLIGAGHSMGGHAVVQAAAARPQRFERLVLVDPVIMDPSMYAAFASMTMKPADHPTSKRKNDWTSWREMFERFEHRGTFALWRPDVLEDYCRYGVVEASDGGGFELGCPPIVEASIYSQSTGRNISELFARVDMPVVILRAKQREGARDPMNFSNSPTWPGLAGAFPNARDVYLPHLTHFIPMQDPQLVARFIASAEAAI